MTILLHLCCGPCATAIIKDLQQRGFLVTAFFYNPNIQPKSEAEQRFDSLCRYLKNNLPLLAEDFAPTPEGAPWPDDYDLPFLAAIKNSPHRPQRCLACYRLRLEATARATAANKFDFFTTTLLSSPHQDITAIKRIGEELADKYHVKFYAPDGGPEALPKPLGNRGAKGGQKKFKGFRSLFTASRRLARQEHLYEQRYCGCLASFAESLLAQASSKIKEAKFKGSSNPKVQISRFVI